MLHCLISQQTHHQKYLHHHLQLPQRRKLKCTPANSERKHSDEKQLAEPKQKPNEKKNCFLIEPSHGQRMVTLPLPNLTQTIQNVSPSNVVIPPHQTPNHPSYNPAKIGVMLYRAQSKDGLEVSRKTKHMLVLQKRHKYKYSSRQTYLLWRHSTPVPTITTLET